MVKLFVQVIGTEPNDAPEAARVREAMVAAAAGLGLVGQMTHKTEARNSIQFTGSWRQPTAPAEERGA